MVARYLLFVILMIFAGVQGCTPVARTEAKLVPAMSSPMEVVQSSRIGTETDAHCFVHPESLEIDEEVAFGPGLARFHYAERQKLDGLVARLRSLERSSGVTLVKVLGYADRSGDEQFNAALMVLRAKAVKDYLVAQGVPHRLFYTSTGRGSRDYVRSEDARLLFRRVATVAVRVEVWPTCHEPPMAWPHVLP